MLFYLGILFILLNLLLYFYSNHLSPTLLKMIYCSQPSLFYLIDYLVHLFSFNFIITSNFAFKKLFFDMNETLFMLICYSILQTVTINHYLCLGACFTGWNLLEYLSCRRQWCFYIPLFYNYRCTDEILTFFAKKVIRMLIRHVLMATEIYRFTCMIY